jgi:hypothetical protein
MAMICLLAAWTLAAAQDSEEPAFTTDFRLEECRFSHTGGNAYFRLDGGRQLIFEGEDEGELLELWITVLDETRWIDFETAGGATLWVKTRVVEEREWVDDELVEISRNFFARCRETSDVYYFGEDVDIYEDGEIVSHEGAWLAGVDEAQPGLIMPGTFLLGSRYDQETAPDVAMDRAEHVAMGLEIEVPAGIFDDCVEVLETTPLDPDEESTKVYCPGIGLVIDDEAELVEFHRRQDHDCDDGGDECVHRAERTNRWHLMKRLDRYRN